MSTTTQRARDLRQRQTEAESLLWQALRNRNLSKLKFRRQHPIGPVVADFACLDEMCVVEIDGGYHDAVADADGSRQQFLEREGWRVLRFSNEHVLDDVEAVAFSIARQLGVEVTFGGRQPG